MSQLVVKAFFSIIMDVPFVRPKRFALFVDLVLLELSYQFKTLDDDSYNRYNLESVATL